MRPYTEDEAASMIINPFYAISFRGDFFSAHEGCAAKEDWVIVNSKLMEDIGAKAWLDQLLDALSIDPDDYEGHEIINPGLVAYISNRLYGEHKPLTTRADWIGANENLIKGLGISKWLWMLLDVLETGGPE
jgi:hypothetical protein